MVDTGYTRSPFLIRGALVGLTEDIVGVVPDVILFQYNPATMTRTLTPFDPNASDQVGRGQIAPTAQPYDPAETISLKVELDAADRAGDGDPRPIVVGVSERIAALEKLLMPSAGLFGDLVGSVQSFRSNPPAPRRRSVPIVLLAWGAGRIVPVRITNYSVEETSFLPTLVPLRASVSLTLRVLPPDVFKCQTGPAKELAIAAYKVFRVQQDVLAVSNAANTAIDSLLSPLPFRI